MVTWGTNQVFNIAGGNNNAPATPAFGSSPAPPAPPAFGSPAPAPAGSFFGSNSAPAPGASLFGKPSTGSLFGNNPTPAPAPGGFFGSSSAPSGGGGIFGNSAPAPSGGLFGSSSSSTPLFGSPSPAPGSGMFCSTPGLFGSSAPAPQNNSNNAPAIPAQAAMQAHMDASARQEAAKVQASLEELHHAYTGTSQLKASPLVTIVYNHMTSEQLQWQFANQQAGGYAIPPKPPQVSEQTWLEAIVNNPDRSTLMPVALVGAEALQARVGWQQQQATQFQQNLGTLQQVQETLQRRTAQIHLDHVAQMHAGLSSRLLRLMKKVELVRCMNLPIQPDELKLVQRLTEIDRQVEEVNKAMNGLKVKDNNVRNVQIPDKQRLQLLFTEHRQSIVYLSEVVQKEKRDIHLLKERLDSTR